MLSDSSAMLRTLSLVTEAWLNLIFVVVDIAVNDALVVVGCKDGVDSASEARADGLFKARLSNSMTLL